MIQMYCCLGNHSPTQGFQGWFQSGDKNVSRNICVRALTQLFSFLWDKHVGLHLLGCQFHRVAASVPFHSHVWVMLSLSQSSQAFGAVIGFYFGHLTVVTLDGFLISLLANDVACLFLVLFTILYIAIYRCLLLLYEGC